jgi:hypothetical protein
MGEHVTYEKYNPISVVPAEQGWKAVFEVCDARDRIVGVSEEDVVVWALCEHMTSCKCGTEEHTEKHENFVCGLVGDEFAEGGLQPALSREGLLGYRRPDEPVEAFFIRLKIDINEEGGDPPKRGRFEGEPAKVLN